MRPIKVYLTIFASTNVVVIVDVVLFIVVVGAVNVFVVILIVVADPIVFRCRHKTSSKIPEGHR